MNDQIVKKIREQEMKDRVFVYSEKQKELYQEDLSGDVILGYNKTHLNTAFIFDGSKKVEEKLYTEIMTLEDFERRSANNKDMELLGTGIISSVNGKSYDNSKSLNLFLELEKMGEIEFKRINPSSSVLVSKPSTIPSDLFERFKSDKVEYPDIDIEIGLDSKLRSLTTKGLYDDMKVKPIDHELIQSAHTTKYDLTGLDKGQKGGSGGIKKPKN